MFSMTDSELSPFVEFVSAWDTLREADRLKKYPNIRRDKFELRIGKRYVKVVAQGSVYAFIDKVTGDIYKPESWAKPAKWIRGNVNSPQHGMEAVGGSHSIRYL